MARKLEEKLRMNDPPIWRRVLNGDLSEKFADRSRKVWIARGFMKHGYEARQSHARIRKADCQGTAGKVMK